MKSDWTKIIKIHNGHSYWTRNSDGAVGIADDSGTYPEDCELADRPPILLDKTRPVALGTGGYFVPVTRDCADPGHTPATPYEALWVATYFGLQIEARERPDTKPVRYTVTVVDEA